MVINIKQFKGAIQTWLYKTVCKYLIYMHYIKVIAISCFIKEQFRMFSVLWLRYCFLPNFGSKCTA